MIVVTSWPRNEFAVGLMHVPVTVFCITTKQWRSDPGAGGALAPGHRVCVWGGTNRRSTYPTKKNQEN